MAEIKLPCGRVALVDDADLPLLEGYRLYTHIIRTRPYVMASRHRERIHLHRLLTKFKRTDHINGNGLDNRRENLRDCTHAQNIQNSRKHFDAQTSKYKGVFLDRTRNKWGMALCVNYKVTRKRFDTELEAARAYDILAKQHHGQFARLNFPEELS